MKNKSTKSLEIPDPVHAKKFILKKKRLWQNKV